MNRVDRLMGYLLLFQSRGLLRAQDFAARFEISERTVYRDIQALCEVGVPIAAMPGEGYRLLEGYYLPPITFSPEEARALFLAVAMLDGFTEAGATKTAVASALEKIRAVLPTATRRQVTALQAILAFYAFPAPALNLDDATFVRLQEAIHERRLVHLRYHAQHSNEVTEREVEPHNLIFLNKTWMLNGYCRLRQGVRVFRLDRIDHLTIQAETFAPRDIQLHGNQAGPLTVTTRFDASIVRWVRERQHFSVAGEGERDENGCVTFTYHPRSFDQIAGWLLSWGDGMELLAPPDLRQRLHEMLTRMQARHQPSQP